MNSSGQIISEISCLCPSTSSCKKAREVIIEIHLFIYSKVLYLFLGCLSLLTSRSKRAPLGNYHINLTTVLVGNFQKNP